MADASASREAIRRDQQAKQRAIQSLWQLDATAGQPREDNLYAILDAARDPRIYRGLRRLAHTDQILPLYQGAAATELAAVAPYIVSLGVTNRVFDWIWEEGWGESWGIFLWSLVSAETLRAHFRRLTMVVTEDGRRLLFRFYDPRVLPKFLETCDAAQLRDMFGPLESYLVEADDGTAVARLSARTAFSGQQDSGLSQQITRLVDRPL